MAENGPQVVCDGFFGIKYNDAKAFCPVFYINCNSIDSIHISNQLHDTKKLLV